MKNDIRESARLAAKMLLTNTDNNMYDATATEIQYSMLVGSLCLMGNAHIANNQLEDAVSIYSAAEELCRTAALFSSQNGSLGSMNAYEARADGIYGSLCQTLSRLGCEQLTPKPAKGLKLTAKD